MNFFVYWVFHWVLMSSFCIEISGNAQQTVLPRYLKALIFLLWGIVMGNGDAKWICLSLPSISFVLIMEPYMVTFNVVSAIITLIRGFCSSHWNVRYRASSLL